MDVVNPHLMRGSYRALLFLLLLTLMPLPRPVWAGEASPQTVPTLMTQAIPPARAAGAVGDPVWRVQCPVGYTVTIYAEGLSTPDGLAFSPAGILHVAEESAGRRSLAATEYQRWSQSGNTAVT
jgi:sugar lactone lactonase YvrE